MSKDRLEEIMNEAKKATSAIELITKTPYKDFLYLHEQAERGVSHSKKLDELHVFLQKNVDQLANEKWGHHVIDAAIHVIEELQNEVETLEAKRLTIVKSLGRITELYSDEMEGES